MTDGEPKEVESILGDSWKLSVMIDTLQKEIESELDGDEQFHNADFDGSVIVCFRIIQRKKTKSSSDEFSTE